MSKNGQKFILEKKFISLTPIIFASFGGGHLTKIFHLNISFCRYLQKDSLEHFEIYGGNLGHVYLNFKSD